MTAIYEWDVETLADGETEDLEDGEVYDHNFFETFGEALSFSKRMPPKGFKYALVLVRDDDDRRAWAYYENGMPEYFHDANGSDYKKVPLRFKINK